MEALGGGRQGAGSECFGEPKKKQSEVSSNSETPRTCSRSRHQ